MSTGYIHGNYQERAMQIIPTTATAAEKLKRQAKTLRKTTGSSLAVALDAVAKENGYDHWKHVTLCLEQSKDHKPVPSVLTDYLDQAAEQNPAAHATQAAFAQGFVFAMDMKDAQDLSLTLEYVECQDGWYLAAKELWPGLIHYHDEEIGATLAETVEPTELLEIALDDLQNFQFYRYQGPARPATLEEAYKAVNKMSFFPPTHVWLKGKFTDISEVPQIKVDGAVVHTSVKGGVVVAPPAAAPAPAQAAPHLTFAIDKIQPGLYRVAALSGGVDVTVPAHYESVEVAIREMASEVPEGFAHYGRAIYAGVSSGTMPLNRMVETAAQIAQQLVTQVGNIKDI